MLLSTGPGISGVAIIRLSGKDALNVILELLTNKEFTTTVGMCDGEKNLISHLVNDLIDEGIVLVVCGRSDSYTGEDMAELHVHGSKAVVDAHSLLDLKD
jgi:tRNA modification GTPase